MNVQLYIDVGFDAKDRAKFLGARWDGVLKKWYVPHGLDLNAFSEWWPEQLKKDMAGLHDAMRDKRKKPQSRRGAKGSKP